MLDKTAGLFCVHLNAVRKGNILDNKFDKVAQKFYIQRLKCF